MVSWSWDHTLSSPAEADADGFPTRSVTLSMQARSCVLLLRVFPALEGHSARALGINVPRMMLSSEGWDRED